MSARSARTTARAWSCLCLIGLVALARTTLAVGMMGPAGFESESPPSANTQELVVCVADGQGRAISGATVVLVATLHGGVSDRAGCVQFASVAPGSYRVRVVIDGYKTTEVAVLVNADTAGYVEVTVRRQNLETGRSETSETSPLSLFHVARVCDGHITSGSQQRSGSFAEGTRRVAIPFSERLRDSAPGCFAGVSRVYAEDYSVRPYLEVVASSNTESVRGEAGAGWSSDRRGYAFRASAATGGPYRDGAGSRVESRFQSNRLGISTFRTTDRMRLDFVGRALLDTRGTRPATGIDVDRAVAASGRLTLAVRDGVGGSSYRFELGGSASDDAWQARSIPGSEFVSLSGSHDRFAIDGAAAIEYPLGDRMRVSARLGARLESQMQESLFQDGLESGRTTFPEIRDGVFDAGADFMFFTTGLGISGSVGFAAVSSSLELRDRRSVRSSLVLPTAKFEMNVSRPTVRFTYKLQHAQWLPSYEVRGRVAGYFWSAQQLIQATPSHVITRGRSTLQRVGLELPRGSVVLHASLSVEWLHDVATIQSTNDESTLATIVSGSGWSSTLSTGFAWEPLGGVRVGGVGHILQARNETLDAPLASLPSSVVGGFMEIAPVGDYPFVRWMTLRRLTRTRVAVQPDEMETPGSLESEVEVGIRIRNTAISFGVLNLGNRVVRDHTFTQPGSAAALHQPGRRFRVTLRLQAPG